MKTFVLAITTYNRLHFLKKCIESWDKTKSNDVNWTLVVADDGSTDGTIAYLNSLNYKNVDTIIIKNNRIGVHQQMNTVLQKLENINYDFGFKIDDDIAFLQPEWDTNYYHKAIKTGYHHLVFCEQKWEKEQFLPKPILRNDLIAYTPLVNTHGFFYTFSKEMINKVGYFDVDNFGFRGMGHVDFTARASRAGYNNLNNPFDISDSNQYLTAHNLKYTGALNKTWINAYDEYCRKKKEEIVLAKNRIYIPFKEIKLNIYNSFLNDVITALSHKVEQSEQKSINEKKWYLQEKEKIDNWYQSKYAHLPNWYVKAGGIFKLFKQNKNK